MSLAAVNIVKVVHLGRLAFNPALAIQKWFENQHFQNPEADQVVILVEHEPVYSLGLRQILDDELKNHLSLTGAQVIKSDRGGLTTFHGPGQLVAYPVFHLNRLAPRLTLRNYVSLLEQVGVHTCRMVGVPADVSRLHVSHTGAWVKDRKICAIGVHCKRHVTTHGLALNCNVDLSWYDHIVPCGILGKGVTSISNELNEQFPLSMIQPQFLVSFQSIFNCSLQIYDPTALKNVLEKCSKYDG